eukprot:933434-Pelagomonas_calceolata.AAC.10
METKDLALGKAVLRTTTPHFFASRNLLPLPFAPRFFPDHAGAQRTGSSSQQQRSRRPNCLQLLHGSRLLQKPRLPPLSSMPKGLAAGHFARKSQRKGSSWGLKKMGVGRGGMAAGAGGEDEGGSAAYRMAGGDLQQCQSPGSPFDDPWLSWQIFRTPSDQTQACTHFCLELPVSVYIFQAAVLHKCVPPSAFKDSYNFKALTHPPPFSLPVIQATTRISCEQFCVVIAGYHKQAHFTQPYSMPLNSIDVGRVSSAYVVFLFFAFNVSACSRVARWARRVLDHKQEASTR